ncbi:MAG: hypothetical protein DMF78_00935 [Acidobacteria bacterium]|nr:MAG: hypothetical protein DMF78_00935 [Acidobacteriota bacterium]
MGTAGYMSPEQIRGEPVDARSDVFALGSVLYEMLCGQRAFRGATPAETMSAILKEDPPELAEGGRQIPAVLDRIVRRCLEKRPEERFQSARDVAFALEAVSAAASSVALTGRERSWPPSAMAAVIALAVLAVAAVALLAVRHRSAPPASFRQLTFRRGVVHSARFAPDGQSAVYAASWEGEPARLYVSRIGSPEVTALAVPPANVLAVSASGEIALTLATRWLVGQWPLRGTLARVPLAGGAPRELLEDVDWADWAPDGKSMAVVHAVGGRVRLEYPIGHVLHVTEGWISHPRISPDGDLVAFLDHPTEGDDGSVLVVDQAGRKTTISAGWASLQGLVWHPTRREVWFSGSPAGGNTSIWAVTLSGRQRLVSQAPARLIVHDMSRAGQLLLTREYLKAGVIGLGAGLPRERDYSWFDWTSVVDISADGTTMLLSEGGGTVQMVPWLYLRKMDGAPAARIGEGGKAWFSPDGKWVLSNDTQQLLLIPIGPGSERRIDRDHISRYQEARWFPDGTRIVFAGSETGGEIRLYVQDVAGGGPRAVGPEGLRLPARLSNPVSPDGTWITAVDAGKYVLHPLNGENARELVGLQPADQPILWADYGRILYVFQAEGLPARVYRLDVRTGRREPWKQILPPDPAGILGFPSFVLTPDQRSYAYSYARQLSELFAAEGLD